MTDATHSCGPWTICPACINQRISESEEQRKRIAELEDVLYRNGFTPCDIPACNCGSWHGRYGIFERWQEIKDALVEADCLDNSVGNLPTKGVKKLIAERDEAVFKAANRESMLEIVRIDMREMHGNLQKMTAERDALKAELANIRSITPAMVAAARAVFGEHVEDTDSDYRRILSAALAAKGE